MGSKVLDELKNTLGLGARANKFKLTLTPPSGGSGKDIQVLVRSTKAPGKSFAVMEVWYKGRLVKVPGDITFEDNWSCTFIDKEAQDIRKAFMKWMEDIDSYKTHDKVFKSNNALVTKAKLESLSSKDNSIQVTYEIHNIWPGNISELTYSQETEGLLEFTVDFNYTHWTYS